MPKQLTPGSFDDRVTLLLGGDEILIAESWDVCEWILENLGPDVPLHFTAFHPDFKLRDKPRTPEETLHAARPIALEVGLHYVYEGKCEKIN